MLGGAWLFITVVLLLAAAILRQVPLLLVALLFFLASGVARLWARYALDRLEYRRHLSATRVFFGETIILEIQVANRKILPLPWVQVRDEVPEEVTFLRGKTGRSHKPTRLVLSNVASLSWYHQITR